HLGRIAPAQLQRDRMLNVAEPQQPRTIAVDDRICRDHLGIEQGMLGQRTVERPAMPVGPIHHRRNAELTGKSGSHIRFASALGAWWRRYTNASKGGEKLTSATGFEARASLAPPRRRYDPDADHGEKECGADAYRFERGHAGDGVA